MFKQTESPRAVPLSSNQQFSSINGRYHTIRSIEQLIDRIESPYFLYEIAQRKAVDLSIINHFRSS